jgi:antitoxin CptB
MDQATLNKLRWNCRRGMLELDVFLQRFLDHYYADLSETDQAIFARFLDGEDQDLFDWLTGKREAEDADLQHMVALIRKNVRELQQR